MIRPAPTRAQQLKSLLRQASHFTNSATVDTLANTPSSHSTSDIAIEDCALLFSAAKARLGRTIEACLTLATTPPVDGSAAWLHASVLECIVALDQLHTTLTNEISRRQRQELDISDLQSARAQVRVELVKAVRCSLCTAHQMRGLPH